MANDPGVGYHFFDDFLGMPLEGTQTTEIQWAGTPYKVHATATGEVEAQETVNSVETPGGIIAFGTPADNEQSTIGTVSEPFKMSGDPSLDGKLWFEARIAFSSTVTNGVGFMVGLAETQLWTFADAVPFNGGDAITNSASFIGFHYPEDDTSTADTVYSDRATSFTAIGNGEVTGLADNTFVKLGMVYDPNETDNCIRFYVDGAELSTKVSKSTLTGLTNLDAGTLGLIASQICDSAGTSINTYMDWWRCAQLRV
tara:strand:- start:216 stop:983 length:768 start_codon:yes stop_codon:yes gene_type:complete